MNSKCSSGKKMFALQSVAEDVLIDLWSKNEYTPGRAPVAVYKCEDCGEYHLTSVGPMNERLSEAIASGKIKRLREGNKWLNKFKGKL